MNEQKKFGKAIHWDSELNQLTVLLENSGDKVIVEKSELCLSFTKNIMGYVSTLFKLKRIPLYLLPSNGKDDSIQKASLRKAILELYQSISVGDVLEVTVYSTTKYSIFAKYKDILTIYIDECQISDSYIQDVGKFYQAGDIINVKIISKDDEKYFVDASIKALSSDTLSNYKRGDIVEGRIANHLSDRTYYVEVSPTVSGLIDWPSKKELPELDDLVPMVVAKVKERGLKLNLA